APDAGRPLPRRPRRRVADGRRPRALGRRAPVGRHRAGALDGAAGAAPRRADGGPRPPLPGAPPRRPLDPPSQAHRHPRDAPPGAPRSRRSRHPCGSAARFGRLIDGLRLGAPWYLAPMMNVAVLGAGAWGTALAKLLADKHNPTVMWSHRREVADTI